MNSIISHGILDNLIVFEVFNNFKGDRHRKYIKTIEYLVKSDLIISDISLEKQVNLNTFFLETLKERRKDIHKNASSLNSHIRGDFIEVNGEDIFNGYYAEPSPYTEGRLIKVDLLEQSQRTHMNRFVRNNIREENYSSLSILDVKNVFMLFPLRVIIDTKVIFIDVKLTIYRHGYAILNFSTKFNDIELEVFNENMWDINVDSAYLPGFMLDIEKTEKNNKESSVDPKKYYKLGGCKNLAGALSRYEEIIKKALATKVEQRESFHTLMISNGNDLGEENSDERKQNIFKILHTPIVVMPPKKHIDSFFENNMFEEKGFSNVYANQHRIVYVLPEDFYKEHKKDIPSDTESIIIEHFYEAFRGDFFFAIEKLMLKKLSNWKYMSNFFNSSLSARKLSKINLNRIYETKFESNQAFYRYGSAIGLVDILFKTCLDSNVIKLLEENKERVLEASELRRSIILSEVSVLTSILVILLTSILSIPAITQTASFFNIESNLLILSCYLVIVFLVIATVFTAFRDKIFGLWFSIIDFNKTVHRNYNAKKNTKKLLQRKNKK